MTGVEGAACAITKLRHSPAHIAAVVLAYDAKISVIVRSSVE
jgi:hypothetical protein